MKVGLDIDGVCCDIHGTFDTRMVMKGHKKVPMTRWTWFEDYPDGQNEWSYFLSNPTLYRHAATVRGTIPGLKVLEHRGVDLVFVTYRNPAAAKATVDWLTELGVKDPRVVHTSDKGSVDWDIHFDDHLETVLALREVGRRAYVFDQPWNQHGRLPRVMGWSGLLATVDQLSAGWHS